MFPRKRLEVFLWMMSFSTTIYVLWYRVLQKQPVWSEMHDISSKETGDNNIFRNIKASPTSLTLPTASHCNAISMGCYTSKNIVKSAESITLKSMTRNRCLSTCSARGKVFAGLSRGNSCICANDVLHFVTLNENKCDLVCTGDESLSCGGENGTELYSITSRCLKDDELPKDFYKSRWFGCVANFKDFYQKSRDSQKKTIKDVNSCVLWCEEQKYRLAVEVTDVGCVCSKFSELYNVRKVLPECTGDSLKVYRALMEADDCESVRFLPPGSTVKKAVLASFPGSGNTWVRHLLERATGIYTSSVYGDETLTVRGFLGEALNAKSPRTFVIKDHILWNYAMDNYHSAIVLMRNPYDATISTFNWQKSGYNHTGKAPEDSFYTPEFRKFAYSWKFSKVFFHVVVSKKPFIVVDFDELIKNPIKETKRMVEFLQVNNGFTPSNLNERLACLASNINGKEKRKSSKLQKDPFTKDLKQFINSEIQKARKTLQNSGFSIKIPEYERVVSR